MDQRRDVGLMMAESPETRRARELLKSSEELLAEVRNRPARLLSATADEPRFTKEAQEVVDRMAAESVRRMAERTAKRSMDKETQAGWDRWARSIAKAEAADATERLAKITGEELGPWIRANSERIAELERRINKLEQTVSGKVAPLRTGTSG